VHTRRMAVHSQLALVGYVTATGCTARLVRSVACWSLVTNWKQVSEPGPVVKLQRGTLHQGRHMRIQERSMLTQFRLYSAPLSASCETSKLWEGDVKLGWLATTCVN
jgi:hypothetical protein